MADQPTEITARWKSGLGSKPSTRRESRFGWIPPSGNPYVTPMELVLMALAGCTGMDVADIMRKKRQEIAGMEIRIRGTRAEDHPRVYAGIELEYIVSGPSLSEEAVARSIELSMTKYCSVGAMLAPSVPIKTSFRIIPREDAAK